MVSPTDIETPCGALQKTRRASIAQLNRSFGSLNVIDELSMLCKIVLLDNVRTLDVGLLKIGCEVDGNKEGKEVLT